MRALCLLLIFTAAKAAVLWGYPLPASAWLPIAYLWQDVLVVLAFAAFDQGLHSLRATPRIAWGLYAALAIYTAINIPVGRVLATPLTRPMLRAARGPLADSMLLYATPANLALFVLLLALAAALPLLLRRAPAALYRWALLAAVPVVLLGPAAARRAGTHGMDRNVITALAGAGLPASTAHSGTDWRTSCFRSGRAEDLSRFAGAARGLNVVMVSLESTAAQYLGLYGAPQDGTPNLARLAQQALVFDNAYAVYPESIKGLFSILCSTFPAFDSRPEAYETVPCRSMAAILAEHGYRTAMFHSGRFAYLGMESIIRNRGYQLLVDAGDISGNQQSSFGVDEPATVERALAWIDAQPAGQPFFLTYLPIAGHHPYVSPAHGPFQGSSELDQYRNSLHYGDASLGTLIEGLRTRGLEKKTLWIIFGDHGEAFGQHPGNYGHTFFLYEENVHVPFLIAAPGLFPNQERVRKVVSLVDTAPTLLDLLGLSLPDTYQGRTMLDGADRMALFFADYSLGLLGLRDGPWKAVYEIESGSARLYNLDTDPRETADVAAREKERASWYAEIVRGWSSAQKGLIAQSAAR